MKKIIQSLIRKLSSLAEDLEALSSVNYRQKIANARKEKKLISASEVKKAINFSVE